MSLAGRLLQSFGRAGEEKGLNVPVPGKKIAGSFQIDCGGMIPSHRIEGNFHHGKKRGG
jgi:hypothetical protein